MESKILEEIKMKLQEIKPSYALERDMEDEREAIENEIGYPALLFWRDSVEIGPEMQRTETYEQRVERDRLTKRVWAARCLCTNCDTEFVTGWSKTVTGICAVTDYDGAGMYPGVPNEDDEASTISPGETVFCPWCEEPVELTLRSKLPKNGRTRRVMVQDVQIIEAGGIRYAVIVAWLKSRWTGRGGSIEDIDPVEAYVLDTDGKLIRLKRHVTCQGGQIGTLMDQWERAKRVRSPEEIRYYSGESINCTKMGSMDVAPIEPEALEGTTAEKTGLAELLADGSACAVEYLRQWRQNPYIENLVKAGWTHTVKKTLYNGERVSDWADLTERRPNRMLGMTREEVQILGKKEWAPAIAKGWKRYREAGGTCTALEYNEYRKTLGEDLMAALVRYSVTPERAQHYLDRQKQIGGHMLADTWRMSDQLGLDMTDQQILFPKMLRETHDRLSVAVAEMEKRKEAEKYREKFRAIVDKYGYLEWTDGDICIRLPRDLTELVREGATLKHCVGGYGSKHVSESDVIFFVRHARRPERSWFTLDIRMNDGAPREIQLHGYGNENARGRRLHIPNRVREFCDRWEREILLPRWREEQRRIAKEKKREEKTRKENVA